jgi:hypothetical protein
MILDTTTKVIRAYLGGAVSTSQPEWTSSWADHNAAGESFTPAGGLGLLNGATPVTLVASPAASVQRQAKILGIFNADTANVTVTVDVYDGTNARRWVRALLEPNWSLQWEPGGTWHVYDEDGIIQASGGGGIVSLTVEEVDGTPTYASTTKLQFDQADGFVLTQPVAGTARIDSTGSPAPDQEARLLAFWRLFNGRGL